MSKIKNTRELVLRAQAHAREDHIRQGTYGRGEVNGHVEFQGCAIGCLAAPHRKRDLRSWLRDLFGGPTEERADVGSSAALRMTGDLEDEFGICPELARLAEAIFEALDTHGDAINFIPAFAKALPEGVNITPHQCRRFWSRATGRPALSLRATAQNYVPYGAGARRVRDELLAWLEGRKRS